MIRRKYNFASILLLLIFIGQTTAATAMVCKMDFQHGSSTMVNDHSKMDHALMNHSMSSSDKSPDSKNDSMSMDCCQSNGSCSMMGCVVLALPVDIKTDTLKIYSEFILPSDILSTIQLPLSVYRPPIII